MHFFSNYKLSTEFEKFLKMYSKYVTKKINKIKMEAVFSVNSTKVITWEKGT